MRKRTIPVFAIAIIVAAGFALAGIAAYYIAAASAENVFTGGNSEITLNETFKNPEIKAGEVTTITKKVTIENTGKNYSAVRVAVKFSSSDVLDYTTADYNETDWTKSGEYWYYKEPLAPGEETSALFNELTLTNPTEAQVKDFNVYVYSESRDCDKNATTAQIKSSF